MRITDITFENREPFYYMAPGDLWETQEDGYFYLGALYEPEDDDLPVAAGCLIFRVQYEMFGEQICKSAALKWLFVDERYRGSGMAAALIGEWQRIAQSAGLDAVVFRLQEEQQDLLACMEHCGFQFAEQPEEICRIPLASISERMSRTAPGIVKTRRLREIREQTFQETMFRLLSQNKNMRESGYLVPQKQAFEPDLSCATTEGADLRTLLLIQKQSDIELRIVVFRAFAANAGKELKELLRTAVLAAAESYSSRVWIELYCPDDQMKTVASSLGSDGEFCRIRRGYRILSEEQPFVPGERLRYRILGWEQSRLYGLVPPSIAQEQNMKSLDQCSPEELGAWKLQSKGLGDMLDQADQLRLEGILAPELSLIYRVNDQVRAMLLVTDAGDDPQSQGELTVRDWYVCHVKALREFYFLLQMLFTEAGNPAIYEDTVSFVCSSRQKKKIVEYLMDGAQTVEEVPDLSLLYPEYNMCGIRLRSVSDVLAAAGYQSILQSPAGGMPVLEILLPESEQVVEAWYEGTYDQEMHTGFRFKIMWQEPGHPENIFFEDYEEDLELDADEELDRIRAAIKAIQEM